MPIRDFKHEYPEVSQRNEIVIDMDNPTTNVIDEKTTNPLQMVGLHAEIGATTVEKLTNWIVTHCSLKDNVPNPATGGPFTVPQMKEKIEKITTENFAGVRMLQQRADEGLSSAMHGEEMPLLIQLPNWGASDRMEANCLKVIPEFNGDGSLEEEAERLKKFLRSIYAMSKGKCTDEACKNAILQKISGTAFRIVDRLNYNYRKEDGTLEIGKPSLKEVASLLEKRYLSDSRPEVANARLNQLIRLDNETYSALEGRITMLVLEASLGEPKTTRKSFIVNKEIQVFKAAINTSDRDFLNTEAQTRERTGLPEMKLTDMVDALNRYRSEKAAYQNVRGTKTTKRVDFDKESMNKTREMVNFGGENQRGNRFKQKNQRGRGGGGRGRGDRGRNNGFQSNRGKSRGFGGNNGNRGSNNGRFQRGRGRGNQSGNRGNQGGNRGNRNASQGRKFITTEMVNVPQNGCLKCGDTGHKFQEKEKCLYGNYEVMSRPCGNCKCGGHHFSQCGAQNKPTVGASAPRGVSYNPGRTGLEPVKFSAWDEAVYNAHEEANRSSRGRDDSDYETEYDDAGSNPRHGSSRSGGRTPSKN